MVSIGLVSCWRTGMGNEPMRVRAPGNRSPRPVTAGPAEWSLPASVGTGEIQALTSLGGFAAMMVVMQHFLATAQQHSQTTIPSLVPHGYMAVDLFVVLSGFIMSYTYQEGFRSGGLSAFYPFLHKRVARIVPLNSFAELLINGLRAFLRRAGLAGGRYAPTAHRPTPGSSLAAPAFSSTPACAATTIV